MTENKRFIETISTGIVIDTVTEKEYNCEMRIDDDFLNLVNTIAEENEQLQKKNDNLVNMIARVQYRADLIKEENEQLRQPNCRNCIHFSCDNADIYCMKKEYESILDCSIAKDCDEYEGLYE